jgi:hypothetical protein
MGAALARNPAERHFLELRIRVWRQLSEVTRWDW